MSDIVIVEDKLKRGISLARQFEELAMQRPELDVHVLAVCYFYPDTRKTAEDEIEKIKTDYHKFEIRPIGLDDFREIMDGYMADPDRNTIAVMDFLLDGDEGADGIPIRRVNIRYARRAEENIQERIWFYTAAGVDNYQILCELFGQEHVLEIESLNLEEDILRLRLEKEEFIKTLQSAAGQD